MSTREGRGRRHRRRWTQPTLHTVAVVTGQLSRRQRWWVAVLETGCADAALDGLTALQAAGLEGISTARSWCRAGTAAGIPRVRP